MAKSHSQLVNLPGAWPLMNSLVDFQTGLPKWTAKLITKFQKRRFFFYQMAIIDFAGWVWILILGCCPGSKIWHGCHGHVVESFLYPLSLCVFQIGNKTFYISLCPFLKIVSWVLKPFLYKNYCGGRKSHVKYPWHCILLLGRGRGLVDPEFHNFKEARVKFLTVRT